MMTIQYDFLKSRNTVHVPEKLWLRYYQDIVNFFDIITQTGLDYSQFGALNEKLIGNNECFTYRSFTSYFQQLDSIIVIICLANEFIHTLHVVFEELSIEVVFVPVDTKHFVESIDISLFEFSCLSPNCLF